VRCYLPRIIHPSLRVQTAPAGVVAASPSTSGKGRTCAPKRRAYATWQHATKPPRARAEMTVASATSVSGAAAGLVDLCDYGHGRPGRYAITVTHGRPGNGLSERRLFLAGQHRVADTGCRHSCRMWPPPDPTHCQGQRAACRSRFRRGRAQPGRNMQRRLSGRSLPAHRVGRSSAPHRRRVLPHYFVPLFVARGQTTRRIPCSSTCTAACHERRGRQ